MKFGISAKAFSATMLASEINSATLLTITTRILQLAAGVAAAVVTARFLAPSGRGEYFVVVTLARTLSQFSGLGQQSSNTYLVARDQKLFGALVANSFWTALVVCGGVSVLVIAAISIGGFSWGVPTSSVWMAALLAPVGLFYMLGTNLLVGIRSFGLFNAFEIASAVALLAALAVAGLSGAGPSGFVAASLIGSSITAAMLMLALWRHGADSLRFRSDVFRSSVRYSTRAYLALLAAFLVLRGNIFMLSAMKGAEQVGYYSVATQITDVLALLPQSAALVLFPNLVRGDLDRFPMMIRSMLVVGALLAAGCLVIGVLAQPLVNLAFGPQFAPAGAVLWQLLPSVFFTGVTAIVSQYLAAIGLPRAQVAIWFAGLFSAMVLSWLLIPRFGAGGAALALSATHLLMFVMMFCLAFSRRRQNTNTLAGPSVH